MRNKSNKLNEHKEEILKMHPDSTLQEMADKFGVSDITIWRFLKKCGLCRSSENNKRYETLKINLDQIKMDIDSMNIPELTVKYNTSSSMLYKLLKENNIKSPTNSINYPFSTKDADNMIFLYENRTDSNEIAKMYKTKGATVRRLLKKRGVWKTTPQKYESIIKELNGDFNINKVREKCFKYRTGDQNFMEYVRKIKLIPHAVRYTANHNFFYKINTEERSYWLGYIASDGNVSKDNDLVILNLGIEDKERLETFRKHLQSDHKISMCVPDKKTGSQTCRIMVYSPKMVKDLAQYGIIPAKTGKLVWELIENNIPKELMKHFIRGYFDGDGCWSCNNKNKLTFKMCGMGGDFMKKMFDYIKKEARCFGGGIYNPKNRGDFWDINFGGRNHVRILNKYLYENSTVFLDRKKNKVQEFLKRTSHFIPNRKRLNPETRLILKELNLLEDHEL